MGDGFIVVILAIIAQCDIQPWQNHCRVLPYGRMSYGELGSFRHCDHSIQFESPLAVSISISSMPPQAKSFASMSPPFDSAQGDSIRPITELTYEMTPGGQKCAGDGSRAKAAGYRSTLCPLPIGGRGGSTLFCCRFCTKMRVICVW